MFQGLQARRGAACVVSGLGPELARAAVELNLEFTDIEMYRTLRDAVQDVRARSDRSWTPDHAWLVAPAFTPDAPSIARSRGVRCFVQQRGHTREV